MEAPVGNFKAQFACQFFRDVEDWWRHLMQRTGMKAILG
jgi:hypothetical protein